METEVGGLLKKLSAVSRVTSGHTIHPISSTFKFDGDKVFGTNLSTSVIANLGVSVDEPFCVNAKLMVDSLKTVSGKVNLFIDGHILIMKTSDAVFRFALMPVSDFPLVETIRDEEHLSFGTLDTIVAAVKKSAATDSTRYVFPHLALTT